MATAAASRETRANTFARLFEAVHEGVYIGTLSVRRQRNHRRQPPPQADVRPRPGSAGGRRPAVRPERFAEPQAREQFLDRLAIDGAVTDYLLRLRRADGTIFWVELTAHASRTSDGSLRIDALVRDVSERKKLDDQSRDLYQQLCRPRRWPRSARRSRASRTS